MAVNKEFCLECKVTSAITHTREITFVAGVYDVRVTFEDVQETVCAIWENQNVIAIKCSHDQRKEIVEILKLYETDQIYFEIKAMQVTLVDNASGWVVEV